MGGLGLWIERVDLFLRSVYEVRITGYGKGKSGTWNTAFDPTW